ncbi:MAG: hypothetical protein AAB609_01725 [Patescibacteria group bacterium]
MKKNSSQNNLATKEDLKTALKRYSTKVDLKNVEKTLRREILRVEERVEETEDKLSKQMKEQHDQVMKTLVDFVGRVEKLEEENSVGVKHTREFRIQVDDHEARLTTLEPQ